MLAGVDGRQQGGEDYLRTASAFDKIKKTASLTKYEKAAIRFIIGFIIYSDSLGRCMKRHFRGLGL